MYDSKVLEEAKSTQEIGHPVEKDGAIDVKGGVIGLAGRDESVKVSADGKKKNQYILIFKKKCNKKKSNYHKRK